MFVNKNDIKAWLDSIGIEKYTINNDLSVDVDGNVDLSYRNLIYIPVQFNVVNGNFNCKNNKLETLKGCPIEVHKSFSCGNNKLKSFEYIPKIIKQEFFWTF